MMNRVFRVCVVLVVVMVMVLPGVAFASPSTLAPDTPQAPLVLTWTQRSAGGFGDHNNAAVSALEVFGGQLYAGTQNDLGAQVWRTANGSNWSPLTLQGFYGGGNGVLFDMIVYNGQLYAGFGAWPITGSAGQIWRTADGTNWQQVTGAWSPNGYNAGVNNFAIFGGYLYMTTYNPAEGIGVYRSTSGDSNTWAPVATGSFGLGSAYGIATGLEAFNTSLYIVLSGQQGGGGPRVYRTSDGASWSQVNTPGFGNSANYASGGFAVHNGYLYVGTGVDNPNVGTVTGGQIWRSPDGTTWLQAGTSGFGSPLNHKVEGMVSVTGTLFAFTDNNSTGTQVWSSVDGVAWEPSNAAGFGNANNKAVALWSNGTGVLSSQLFLGTFNQYDATTNPQGGAQVWSATPPVITPPTFKLYLPFIAKG